MNLEFMSCILYGLKEIYLHKRRKDKKLSNALDFRTSSTSLEEVKLYISGSKGQKRHKICYQKLFTEEDVGIPKEIKKKTFLEELEDMKKEGISLKSFGNQASSSIATSLLEDENKSAKHDAIIIEHCPYLFEKIRIEDEIDENELLMSLDPLANKQNMLKLKESAGKSGSFFFFSYDKQFIIKTIKEHELETMLGNFMEAYYNHILDDPDSLLSRIYGLFTVEIK